MTVVIELPVTNYIKTKYNWITNYNCNFVTAQLCCSQSLTCAKLQYCILELIVAFDIAASPQRTVLTLRNRFSSTGSRTLVFRYRPYEWLTAHPSNS